MNLNPYELIISISAIIIISFFFNILAKRTNIPSVLMLIALGVGISYGVQEFGSGGEGINYLEILKVLGNVGLVMIVLEAALDLKLTKEKTGVIVNSFLVAIISLVGSSFAVAAIIFYMVPGDFSFYQALCYGVPLSIMSSAIIIPSVGGLMGKKKEFMVYESTFSDILGIMFFYFLVGQEEGAAVYGIALDITLNIVVTIVISIVVAYGMVYIFQHLKSQVKLFLVIAVLMLMFGAGKLMHLSSLLFILAFGLVLNNTKLFFQGKLSKYINEDAVKPILHDFHILTLESAFVIRTFFFVIFGMYITLGSLLDVNVALVSIAIIGSLYVVRFAVLKSVVRKGITPELYIAPRGLITILLFFVLTGEHPELVIESFDPGILLFIILITSIVMTISLITYRGEKVKDVLLSQIPKLKKDLNKDGINDNYEKTVEDNVENRGLGN